MQTGLNRTRYGGSGMLDRNADSATVDGFGDEWTRFDQSGLSEDERREIFDKYFGIFPFPEESRTWVGFDFGCGSGRWAALVAPRVAELACIDASTAALAVARRNLQDQGNCKFFSEPLEQCLPDASQDFGYSLGVLHHVPDTQAAMTACTRKLKSGAPFLVYLYYAFDNRPAWFRLVWRCSELMRFVISSMPHGPRYVFSQIIAATVYWPLARLSKLASSLNVNTANWPLSFYSTRSFYVMRNDALDRFGTRIEQRFTRAQIEQMMKNAGLRDITFSDRAPFWCALGYKA
jgi:ubiquinone/menaquinone biosynthesis C-methylase UbiE